MSDCQRKSRIVYCANPKSGKNDYLFFTLKNYEQKECVVEPVDLTIQLTYSDVDKRPTFNPSKQEIERFWARANKEPPVPFTIIPTKDLVNYSGDFDYIVVAKSPNYTPCSADYILEVFREYITEV